MQSNILLLEDDEMIASGVSYALTTEGYNVILSHTVADARKQSDNFSLDLAILDMQLPDGKGSEISDRLHELGTAIIFLTVVDDENTIVKAFDEGAADYIVKPFRIRELLARVKRVISMNNPAERESIIRMGQIKINTDEGKVYVRDSVVMLTALEYRLLLIFVNNKGRLLSRQQILDHIWDIDGNFVEDNTLTVYVKRLREKLGDAINIETVRGLGYRVGQ